MYISKGSARLFNKNKTYKYSMPQKKHMNLNFLIITALTVFVLNQIVNAQKTDIIRLYNGDELTGEIKDMEYAKVRFKTDAMGTIYIEWDKIDVVTSDKRFQIDMVDGSTWFAMLETVKDTSGNQLAIIVDSVATNLDFDDIVRIIPIKSTFWDRIDASADLGFNFTKASEVAQLNFSGIVEYRTWRLLRTISLSSLITSQTDTAAAQNHNINLGVVRTFDNAWFFMGYIGLQKNTQLGIDLRLLGGGTYGNEIIHTNTAVLGLSGGAQLTRELAEDGSQWSAEGVLRIDFKKFEYNDPEIDLTSDLSWYPTVTPFGRHRLELNIKLKWEIISDLYWSLTLYTKYDSDPPPSSTTNNDYGITLSFGWSY